MSLAVTSGRATRSVRALAILVVTLIAAFPFVWMVLASFKHNVQISDVSQSFIFSPTLDNYVSVLETNNYFQYFINSLTVSLGATLASLVLGVPAAWAIAKFSMARLNTLVLLARIIPAVTLLVPWYLLFSKLEMVGGYPALMLSHVFICMPLIMWIMTGFFASLPAELDEAGRIDGLSEFGTFLHISLPLSVPGIATGSILAIIFSWNNFLFSLVLADTSTLTLPVAIYQFMSYAGVDWGGLMAAASVMTLPIIVFGLFAQRYVVAGLTAGATKG